MAYKLRNIYDYEIPTEGETETQYYNNNDASNNMLNFNKSCNLFLNFENNQSLPVLQSLPTRMDNSATNMRNFETLPNDENLPNSMDLSYSNQNQNINSESEIQQSNCPYPVIFANNQMNALFGQSQMQTQYDIQNQIYSQFQNQIANEMQLNAMNIQVSPAPYQTLNESNEFNQSILTSEYKRAFRPPQTCSEFQFETISMPMPMTMSNYFPKSSAGQMPLATNNFRFSNEHYLFNHHLIHKMRKTRCLTVVMKHLTEVPEEVFNAACQENVAMVDFSKNSLPSLPNGLIKMRDCASELIFAQNQLCSIDPFISQFRRVTLVNFSGNHLTELPKEFGCLITLRELNLANNRFEYLPSCLYELQNLEILNACNNRIKFIDATPQGLGAMRRLATLDLSNNNIEHVPPILGNLTNLISLELIGNPFRQPRHQILEKGTDAVMSYLRDRIPLNQL